VWQFAVACNPAKRAQHAPNGTLQPSRLYICLFDCLFIFYLFGFIYLFTYLFGDMLRPFQARA
jgi:hypothetical protein